MDVEDPSPGTPRTIGTVHALQLEAEHSGSALGRQYPGSHLPWRVVADMLAVSALEVRYPVTFFILMEPDDSPPHRAPSRDARACAL